MTPEMKHEEIRNPDGTMENAKALLRVTNHLDAETDKNPTDSLLFHGPETTVVATTIWRTGSWTVTSVRSHVLR